MDDALLVVDDILLTSLPIFDLPLLEIDDGEGTEIGDINKLSLSE